MDEWLSEELHKHEDRDRTDMDENIRTNICGIYLNHQDTCSDRGQMSSDFYIHLNL